MERLNNGEDRQRSQPPGEIASEKLAVNLDTLRELQATENAIKRGALFDVALGKLNENDGNLVTYAVWRNNNYRRCWNMTYLDKDGYYLAARAGVAYFGEQMMSLLGDFYSWNQERVEWLFKEMRSELAAHLRQVLTQTVRGYDQTAQEVIKVLDFQQPDAMKPIVDALLDSEMKIKAGCAFAPPEYRSSLIAADFGSFVEIMAASIEASAAQERTPALA